MSKVKLKFKVWNWIVIAVMVIVVAGMIVADYECSFWSAQITNLLCGTGLDFSGEDVEQATAMSDKLVNDIGDEGIVLLKNTGGANGKGILPLADSDRKVNLFGWASHDDAFHLTGGGSGAGWIVDDKKVPLSKALENSGFTVNRGLLDKYKQYRRWRDGLKLTEPAMGFYTDEILNDAKSFSQTAIITIMRFGSEGLEMPLEQTKTDGLPTDSSRTYLQLSTEEEALIDMVTENFERVIVVLDTANSMELGFLDNDKIDAALLCGMLGQSGANAIGRIMTGDVNPSGKTVDTYPYDHKSNPSYANMRRDGDHIHYVEDIYIGYKWYETAFADGITVNAYDKTYDYSTEEGYRNVVQYPFGYGLSYTEFTWAVDSVEYVSGSKRGDLAGVNIADKKTSVEVKVAVTNTGSKAGKDIVQLYYTAPYDREANDGAGGIEKAAINLVAFEKTPELEPGQTANLTLSFDLYDMASYDCYDRNGNGSATYELDAGEYSIKLMTDAHTVATCENAVTTFDIPKTITYKLDPKTKQIVKNRFTGDNAYAGVPIDGSTAGDPVQYLTRGNFAGTFPTSATPNRGGGNVTKANNYVYDGYDAKYTAEPATDTVDGDRLLIWSREDGSQPSKADLNGESGAQLVLNESLVETLGRNYKAPEYDRLLDQITKAELLNLVECSGYGNDAIVSIGKANNRDYDGPSGLRPLDGTLSGMEAAVWSGYPGLMTLAQAYSKSLAFQVGRAIGNEANVTGLSGWYAPAVNLHRTPYNGRYFEYFSEDGVLSGELGAYVIKGAATVNVYCYLKHLALSEMGINPTNLNVWVTEQALRETYLRPFEICVKEGGANAVMTAFNRIGGTWAGGCKAMNVDILRTEWGFRGVTITDWSTGDSYMNPTQGLRAGNDIWLNPNDTSGKPLDRNDPTNYALARNSAHNMIYTICSTYCRYKDYDPADGEFMASVGIRNVNKVFPWWIPVLVAFNVIVFGIIIFETTWIFIKARKRYALAAEAAESGTTLEQLEKQARIEKKMRRAEKNRKKDKYVEAIEPERYGYAAMQERYVKVDAEREREPSAPPQSVDDVAPLTQVRAATENVAQSASETEKLRAENAELKEQIAELKGELNAFTLLADELKSIREKQADAERKRKEAAKLKPKVPKAPTAKQQIDELKKELDEIRNLLNKA